MYRIIYYYDNEGWEFEEEEYQTAEEALGVVTSNDYTLRFRIVKVVEFTKEESL